MSRGGKSPNDGPHQSKAFRSPLHPTCALAKKFPMNGCEKRITSAAAPIARLETADGLGYFHKRLSTRKIASTLTLR